MSDALPPIHYPEDLPVSGRRDDILAALRSHQVVVVAGATGSGKTTQLPKMLLELGRSRIAHTQPRRIAARSVAERIAEELGVSSYLIENADQLRPEWLTGKTAIGVTAGASAPDVLVQDVVERLRQMHGIELEMMNGVAENVRFRLPPELTESEPPRGVAESAGAAQ